MAYQVLHLGLFFPLHLGSQGAPRKNMIIKLDAAISIVNFYIPGVAGCVVHTRILGLPPGWVGASDPGYVQCGKEAQA